MSWVLLGLLSAVTIAFVTQTFLGRKDNRETMAARELIAESHKANDALQSALDIRTAELKVKTDQYEREQKLRIAIEVERNSAFATVRKQIVEHIKNARSTTDANRLIADLLSLPLGVQAKVPEGRGTAPGPDSLIDPFADVQSP
jgi:hypothetical protein